MFVRKICILVETWRQFDREKSCFLNQLPVSLEVWVL